MGFKFNPFTGKLDKVNDTTVDSDEKVKVSVNDTTPDYLSNKITAADESNTTSAIEIKEVNDGSDEDLKIAFDESKISITESQISDLSHNVNTDENTKVSSNDTTAKYLEDAIVTSEGTNSTNAIEITTLNDGSDEDLQIQFDESKISITESQISDLSHTVNTDENTKVSSNDTTAKYLEDAIVVSDGTNSTNALELSTLNDGSDEDVQIQFDESKISITESQISDLSHTPEGANKTLSNLTNTVAIPNGINVSPLTDAGMDLGDSTHKFAEAHVDDYKISDVGSLTTIPGVAGAPAYPNAEYFTSPGTNGPFNYPASITNPSATFDTMGFSSDISIAFWIRMPSTAPAAFQFILSYSGTGGGEQKWNFQANNSQINFSASADGTALTTMTTTASPLDNTWHHVAVTYDRTGNMQFYIDGVADGSPVATPGAMFDTSGVSTKRGVVMGVVVSGTALAGDIDELMLYNSLLTGPQVLELVDDGASGTQVNDPSLTTQGSPTRYYRMGEDDAGSPGPGGLITENSASGDNYDISGSPGNTCVATGAPAGNPGAVGGPSKIIMTSDNDEDIDIDPGTGSVTLTTDSDKALLTNTPSGTVPRAIADVGYVSSALSGVTSPMNYKGDIANPASPTEADNAQKGDYFLITGSGTLFSIDFNAGDHLVMKQDITGSISAASEFTKVDNTEASDILRTGNLNAARIFVGNASNLATSVTMSGDVAIDNAGATTIQALAVDTGKISATSITAAKLGSDVSGIALSGGNGSAIDVDVTTAPAGTVASADEILIADVDDSNNVKKVTAQSIANLAPAGSDELIKVSSNDTTAKYLENAIVVSDGTNATNALELSTLNDASDEDIQIQFDESKISITESQISDLTHTTNTDVAVSVSANDTTPGQLLDKIIVADESNTTNALELKEVNDAGDEDLKIAFDESKISITESQISDLTHTVNTDENIKVSSDDTTTGYLFDKTIATEGSNSTNILEIYQDTPGGDENLELRIDESKITITESQISDLSHSDSITTLIKDETDTGFTMSNNEHIFAGSTSSTFSLNLPAGVQGERIRITDTGPAVSGTWASFNITVVRNGSDTIDGAAADFTLDVDGGDVEFVYTNTTWRVLTHG